MANMYVGTGSRLLMVVVLVVLAVAEENLERLPRSKPSRVFKSNMDSVQLLKHIMKHEKKWTDVLQEEIKMLGDPPYMEYTFIAPKVLPLPADGTVTSETYFYSVREIVATIDNNYSTIRSFVEYGARAVRRALSCFAFRHLLFQAHCVSMMIIKSAKPITVLNAAVRLKENAGAYINVLTVVSDADLDILLTVYWEAVKITQADTVKNLQGQLYPPEFLDALRSLRQTVNNYLEAQCHPFTTNEEFFRLTGVQKKSPMMSIHTLLPLVKTEQLSSMSHDHAKYMTDIANNLGIVTMPDHLWLQLFYYAGRPRPITNEMDATNPPVMEDPNSND